MSEAAKAARSAMKDKIKRLLMPLKGKVDASDYGPEEVLDADVKTGMRPISRRAYKSGGKVSGECGPMRADRKPRNSGGKATTPNSMINRNDKDANEDREGKKHVGALARGGVPKDYRSGTEREIDRESSLSSLQRQMDLHQDNEDWDKHDAARAEYNKISKKKNYAPPHRKYESEFKSGGEASDKSQDKALVKKAFRQHENAEHGGKHVDLKLKRGGMPHKGGGGMLDADDDMPEREPMRASRMMDDDGPRYNRGAVDKMIRNSRQRIGGREAKMIHALLKGREGSEYARGGAPKATSVSDGQYQGTRPTGGRLARASGGKTGKGKMNVNIIISTGSKGQGPQPGMPGGPLGTPPGGLIAAPPPPSAPPPALPPPPMPMGGPPGAMGGAPMGGMPPMPRRSGGRTGHGVYRTYKDMDAGSGGGLGRLEKVEIQEHKK